MRLRRSLLSSGTRLCGQARSPLLSLTDHPAIRAAKVAPGSVPGFSENAGHRVRSYVKKRYALFYRPLRA